MNFTTRLGLSKPNSDPVTGDFVDIDILNVNADKLDAALGAEPVTSATRPATPYDGKFIRETDTRRLYAWNATQATWEQLATASPARFRAALDVERDTTGQTFYNGYLAGEANPRYNVRGDGMVSWGTGAAAADVNLYRRAANHLGTDDSFQATGYCSGAATESVRTATSANVTTVELVIQSVTFNAVAGAGYVIHAIQHVQSTVTGDTVRMRLRYAAGASVTSAGTKLLTILPVCETAGKGLPWHMSALFVAPTTGQYTVGVTMIRDSATAGVITSFGAADRAENYLLVTGA